MSLQKPTEPIRFETFETLESGESLERGERESSRRSPVTTSNASKGVDNGPSVTTIDASTIKRPTTIERPETGKGEGREEMRQSMVACQGGDAVKAK